MQSLHESELRYKELIEFAVDGILIGSKDGVILVANTYMQHLTGRSVRNLIGLHVSELFSHDQLNDIPLRFDRIESGDMVVSRRNVLHVNGTLIPVEMHTKMMPDGTYQSIYHDITKRKQAENQLKESRELYKLITDKMTDVVWLMDLNGTSVFVSPSIEQFTGFSVEEYLHQTIDDRFAPDSAKYGKALFGSEITRLTQHPELLTEFSTMQWMEYVCKNGGTRWGEVLMTPYMNPEGEWIGIHGVTRDITDRKRSEEELKDKAAELQRFNSLMIGREMKMIELKKEINGLLKNQGKPEKYNVYD
jgi:PAS domain S-box-containing protein